MEYTICVSGERDNPKFKPLIKTLFQAHHPTRVIVGNCTGVDTSVQEVCDDLNIHVISL